MFEYALIAAGGNSRLARSLRAKKQLRDKKGQWIEMGGGANFRVRTPQGRVLSVNGQFVGAGDGEPNSDNQGIAQVWVSNPPEGLNPGFYHVNSGNMLSTEATLSDTALERAGIDPDADQDSTITELTDADVQDLASMQILDAPLGFRKDPNGPGNFLDEDGVYSLRSVTGSRRYGINALREDGKRENLGYHESLADALDRINTLDAEGEDSDVVAPQTQNEGGEGQPPADAPAEEPEEPDLVPGRKAGSIIDHVMERGGMTVDTETGELAKDGYVVGTDGSGDQMDANLFFNDRAAARQHMVDYVNRNKELLASGGKRLGLWHDSDGEPPVVEFDVVDQVPDEAEALRLGGERNQGGIYDVANDTVINTGDNGERSADDTQPAEPEQAPDAVPGPVEPTGNDAGADGNVGGPDSGQVPAQPAANPVERAPEDATDTDLEALYARQTKLIDNITSARSDAAALRMERQLQDTNDRIEAIEQARAARANQPAEEVTPSAEDSDSSDSGDSSGPSEAPEADGVREDDAAPEDSGSSEPAEEQQPDEGQPEPEQAAGPDQAEPVDEATSAPESEEAPAAEDPAAAIAEDREFNRHVKQMMTRAKRAFKAGITSYNNSRDDTEYSIDQAAARYLGRQNNLAREDEAFIRDVFEDGYLYGPNNPDGANDKGYWGDKTLSEFGDEDPKEGTRTFEERYRTFAQNREQRANQAPAATPTPEPTPQAAEPNDPTEFYARQGEKFATEKISLLETQRDRAQDNYRATSAYDWEANRAREILADQGLPMTPLNIDHARGIINAERDRLRDAYYEARDRHMEARGAQLRRLQNIDPALPEDSEGTEAAPETPEAAPEPVNAPEAPAPTPEPENAPEAAPAPAWEQSGVPAAEAYDQMEHDPTDPEVQASYQALQEAVADQYLEMKAMGLDIILGQEDPYPDSAAMLRDVTENKRLAAFADGGATLPEGHPMNKMVDIDGEQLHLNDVFRAVHDYFGHVKSGERGAVVSFGPKGEWEAWRTHRLTLPRESWMALWDETRGQNTWTNYNGDNASLPLRDRPFAEQKAGKVPEEIYAADLIGTEPEAAPTPEAAPAPVVRDRFGRETTQEKLDEQNARAEMSRRRTNMEKIEAEYGSADIPPSATRFYERHQRAKAAYRAAQENWRRVQRGERPEPVTPEIANVEEVNEAVDTGNLTPENVQDAQIAIDEALAEATPAATAESEGRTMTDAEVRAEQNAMPWRDLDGVGWESPEAWWTEKGAEEFGRPDSMVPTQEDIDAGLSWAGEGEAPRRDTPINITTRFDEPETEAAPAAEPTVHQGATHRLEWTYNDSETGKSYPQDQYTIEDYSQLQVGDYVRVSAKGQYWQILGFDPDGSVIYGHYRSHPYNSRNWSWKAIPVTKRASRDKFNGAYSGQRHQWPEPDRYPAPPELPEKFNDRVKFFSDDYLTRTVGNWNDLRARFTKAREPWKARELDKQLVPAREELEARQRGERTQFDPDTNEPIGTPTVTPEADRLPEAEPRGESLDEARARIMREIEERKAAEDAEQSAMEDAQTPGSDPGTPVYIQKMSTEELLENLSPAARRRGSATPEQDATLSLDVAIDNAFSDEEDKDVRVEAAVQEVLENIEEFGEPAGLPPASPSDDNTITEDGELLVGGVVEELGEDASDPDDADVSSVSLPLTVGDRPAETIDLGYQDSDRDYDNMKFPPTQEQRDVVMGVLGGRDVAVQALAGTGKTSTLELIANRIKEVFPDKRIIYVAFNKTVQEEADSRMPDNTESRTGDSLSWRSVGRRLTDKKNKQDRITMPSQQADFFNIREVGDVDREDVARDLKKVITAFAISDVDEIGEEHFEGLDTPATPETLGWAQAMWRDINDPKGMLPFGNDHATKIWALTRPDLSSTQSGVTTPADIVFFDEAQDINPVMARVIREQNMQKVYVGDQNQAIYGFRGSVDELDKAEVDLRLPLTTSWRFGPQVAGMGNRFLTLLGAKHKVRGGGQPGEVIPSGTMRDANVVLTRSNGGAVKAIMEELGRGRTVGVTKNTKAEVQSVLGTARWLKNGGRKPKLDENFAGYRTWSEVERDVTRGKADKRVEMFYNLIQKTGLESLEDAMRKVVVIEKDKPGEAEAAPQVRQVNNPALPDLTFGPGSSGQVLPGVNYRVEGGTLILTGPNTFKVKDSHIKPNGKFRFNRDDKSWRLQADEAELQRALTAVRGDYSAGEQEEEIPPTPVADVVVTTAHKAKGLEWDNVKIADDFRGPEVQVDPDTGEETTIMPDPEELRLAYVAVTRAAKVLDPGALSWVFDYTEDEDENPDVLTPRSDAEPAGELPGEEAAPAPTPEPTPEAAPAPTPEPEPTPEVAPEPLGPPVGDLTDEELDDEYIERGVDIQNDRRVNAGEDPREVDRLRELEGERERRRIERENAPAPEPEPEPTPSVVEPTEEPVGDIEVVEEPPQAAPAAPPPPPNDGGDDGGAEPPVPPEEPPTVPPVDEPTTPAPDEMTDEEIRDFVNRLTGGLGNPDLERQLREARDARQSDSEPTEEPEATPTPEPTPEPATEAPEAAPEPEPESVGDEDLGEPDEEFRDLTTDGIDRAIDDIDRVMDLDRTLGDPEDPALRDRRARLVNERDRRNTALDTADREAMRRDEASTPKVGVAKNYLESKDVPEERREEIVDILDSGDAEAVTEVLEELKNIPNRADSGTRPRQSLYLAEPEAADEEEPDEELLNPGADDVTDPNLIMDDLRRRHPNHEVLDNGDIVIARREKNGKVYDLIVRRTRREHFFPYMRETDPATGQVRVSKVGTETHSYRALNSKLNVGKEGIASMRPGTWMDRNKNVEDVRPEDLGLYNDPLDNFIDGTDLPRTDDDMMNASIAAIAQIASRSGDNPVARALARQEAAGRALPDEVADRVFDAVARRAVFDAQVALGKQNPNSLKPPHVSYEGQQLQEGDWVDWTDWRTTSPTYGMTFRGRVHTLRYKDNGAGGRYRYSDTTYAVFPEYNRIRGAQFPNSQQRSFVSSNLRVVDGPGAAMGAPFFAKDEEIARRVNRVVNSSDFDVPAGGSGTRKRRRTSKPAETVEPKLDAEGQSYIGTEANPVAVPSAAELAEEVSGAEGVSVPVGEIRVGDVLPAMDEGRMVNTKVTGVEPAPNGGVSITTAEPKNNGDIKVKTRTVTGPKQVLALRNESVPPLVVRPAADFRNEDAAGNPASDIQRAKLHLLAARRELTGPEQEMVMNAANDPALTFPQAADFIENLANNRKKIAEDPSYAQVRALAQQIAEDVRRENADAAADDLMVIVNAADPDNPGGSQYDGFAVKRLEYEQMADDDLMEADGFEKMKVHHKDFQVGDVIPFTRYNGETSYYQILGAGDGTEGNYTIRETDEVGNVYYNQSPLAVWGGEDAGRELWRKTDLDEDDYIEPGFRAKMQAHAGQQHLPKFNTWMGEDGFEVPDTDMQISRPNQGVTSRTEVADNNYQVGQELVDKYNQGFKGLGFQSEGGADNSRSQVIEFRDGSQAFVKVLNNEDYAEGNGIEYQMDSEILANLVAQTIGFKGIEMVGLDDGRTILTQVIPGVNGAEDPTWEHIVSSPELFDNSWKMAILDLITNNYDRHSNNWRVSENDGEPYPIDHGRMGWDDDVPDGYGMDRSEFIQWALGANSGNGFRPQWGRMTDAISSAELLRIQNELNFLRGDFVARGRGEWFDKMMTRFDKIMKADQAREIMRRREETGDDF